MTLLPMMNHRRLPRQGKRIRILIGEAQEWQGKPLYRAIMELARHYGTCAAAWRGRSHHHTGYRRVIDIIKSNERVEALLPLLDRVIQQGIITVTPVEIVSGGGVR